MTVHPTSPSEDGNMTPIVAETPQPIDEAPTGWHYHFYLDNDGQLTLMYPSDLDLEEAIKTTATTVREHTTQAVTTALQQVADGLPGKGAATLEDRPVTYGFNGALDQATAIIEQKIKSLEGEQL